MSVELDSLIDDCSRTVAISSSCYRVLERDCFLSKIFKINLQKDRCASIIDFNEIKSKNYTQNIYRRKEFLEKVGHTNPAYYKIKGVEISDYGSFRSQRGYGGQIPHLDEFESYMTKKNTIQPLIHNIRFRFNSDLFDKVKPLKKPDPSNNTIYIKNITSFQLPFSVHLNVHPTFVELYVKCTNSPIVFSNESMIEFVWLLSSYLTNIKREFCIDFFHDRFSIWTLTNYHLNKDLIIEVENQDWHFQWRDVAGVLYRAYTKPIKGDKIVRVEIEENNVNKPILKELQSKKWDISK